MIRLDIVNDGTGDVRVGNYDVTLVLPQQTIAGPGWREVTCRVEGFSRDRGAVELLKEAAYELEMKEAEFVKHGRRGAGER